MSTILTPETLNYLVPLIGLFVVVICLIVWEFKSKLRNANSLHAKALMEAHNMNEAIAQTSNVWKQRFERELEQRQKWEVDFTTLRKDLIEQSELATSWRQKHDTLAAQAKLLHNDYVRLAELLKEAEEEVKNLEVEEKNNGNEWETRAFTMGYVIPKGIKVICVSENSYIKTGSTGLTTEKSDIPYIKWDGEDYSKLSDRKRIALASFRLQPLNPLDHPDHPQFRGKGGSK